MNIWADANGWPVPPQVLLACLIAEILYFRGWRLLAKAEQRKAARAREHLVLNSARIAQYRLDSWPWRGAYFVGAIFVFLLASSAPIDILSSRLLWIHMIQHLLILAVMAPLLVAAAPIIPLWLGLPRRARWLIKTCVKLKVRLGLYKMAGWLRQPAISCALLLIGIWGWHWPPLYDLALTNAAIHDWLEHSTFLAVSVLFWAQLISSPPLHPRLGYLGCLGCVGFAMAQNVVLAALIGFSQVPLYAPYAHLFTGLGGLSPIMDQQLGAGIMWTFGDLPFGIAFATIVHQWLSSQSGDQGEVSIGVQTRD